MGVKPPIPVGSVVRWSGRWHNRDSHKERERLMFVLEFTKRGEGYYIGGHKSLGSSSDDGGAWIDREQLTFVRAPEDKEWEIIFKLKDDE